MRSIKHTIITFFVHLGYTNTVSLLTLVLFIISSRLFGFQIKIFLLLFLTLFIHELGHYLAARYFGYHGVKMIFILPFFGGVTAMKELKIFKEEVFLILAGPVPGILIGYLLFGASQIDSLESLNTLALIFILINGVNLIPVYPLDGYQIVRLIFIKNALIQRILSFLSFGIILAIVLHTWDIVAIAILLMAAYDLLLVLSSSPETKTDDGLVTATWSLKTDLYKRLGYRIGDLVRDVEVFLKPSKKYQVILF